ncbi:hypothetical protein BDF14DRAFT_1812755 [Spinellus fusiger]|nr:hypothetical protein BDF14DRAFT_1812755 [Spinellus fusiger]
MSQHKGKVQPKNGQWVDDTLPLSMNEELLATTCLHLACKATDIPRKVRDLVNVGYRYYHLEGPMLQVDENYFKMRSSLVTSELLLVRTLGYNLEVELPFAFCLNTLRGMGSVQFFGQGTTAFRRNGPRNGPSMSMSTPGWQKEVWRRMEYEMDSELSAVARLSWMFLWDSICSPKLSMHHSVPGVALGCLYLALRTSNADLPMTMSEWVDMWGASENISVQAVRDVVTDLLQLYESTAPHLGSTE